jgi:ADP-ribose pyrophosphatase
MTGPSPSPYAALPEIKRQETVYRGYFDVRVDLLHLPHGPTLAYTCLDVKAHASAVLAKTKTGKFVINKEYRHPTGKWLLGCPGGRIDSGESPLEAAQRELLEETGYGGGSFYLMGSAYAFPAVCDQMIYYIYAEGVDQIQSPSQEPFELIHIALKTETELMNEVASGHPIDGVLCTALLLVKRRTEASL